MTYKHCLVMAVIGGYTSVYLGSEKVKKVSQPFGRSCNSDFLIVPGISIFIKAPPCPPSKGGARGGFNGAKEDWTRQRAAVEKYSGHDVNR